MYVKPELCKTMTSANLKKERRTEKLKIKNF